MATVDDDAHLSTSNLENLPNQTAKSQLVSMFQFDHLALTLVYLILSGKLIQSLVFGGLRQSEKQNVKDKAINYLYTKTLFLLGIIGVQSYEETIPWAIWYSILVLLLLVTQICKDRFEYLIMSPSTPTRHLWRLGATMFLILICSIACLIKGYHVGQQLGFDILLYLLADSLYVTTMCVQVLTRYAIHTYDTFNFSSGSSAESSSDGEGKVWEERASFVYYTDLIFGMLLLSIDFMNHVNMMRVNSVVSLPTIICGLKLHSLFREIKLLGRRHRNYLTICQMMGKNFPMATQEELYRNCDDCSICWDKMHSARKLPCGHLFHNSCLRSWLEQDMSCPTCRSSLKSSGSNSSSGSQSSNNSPVSALSRRLFRRSDVRDGGESDLDLEDDHHDSSNLIDSSSPHDDVATATTFTANFGNSTVGGADATLNGQLFRGGQYFYFDTSRYSNHPLLSWLPAISVEASWFGRRDTFPAGPFTSQLSASSSASSSSSSSISTTYQISETITPPVDQSPSENVRADYISSATTTNSIDTAYAVNQIHEMFPDCPRHVIQQDLRQTQSVEMTIDNIIENRIQTTPTAQDSESTSLHGNFNS